MNPAAHPVPAAARRERALVVDDGAVERLAGKALLEKLGFEAATAASAEEALAWLAANDAALVLCDVSMPGLGGLGLLQAARQRANAPRFIMVTSHDEQAVAQAALQGGASACLAKPLRFDALREKVAMLALRSAG